MFADSLTRDLYTEICRIPLIDPHSHIDPHRPAARTLDDILGYHYYTELAHSAGMDRAPLASTIAPRERVRAILAHMDRFDNTVQYAWFIEIARTFPRLPGQPCHRKRYRRPLRRRPSALMAQPGAGKRTFLKASNIRESLPHE